MEAHAMRRPLGLLFAMNAAWGLGCSPEAPPLPVDASSAAAPRVAEQPSSPALPEALSSERDSFDYEAGDMRDPFLPPRRTAPEGPRFHELALLGVVIDPAADHGVALLRVGGPSASQTVRVQPGDELGDVRVLAVRRDRVVVAVQGAAGQSAADQAEIVLPRPAGGGAS